MDTDTFLRNSMKASTCCFPSIPEGASPASALLRPALGIRRWPGISSPSVIPRTQAANPGRAGPRLVRGGQGFREPGVAPKVAGPVWSPDNPSAQAQQPCLLAQRIAPVAGRDTPDCGDGLQQAPSRLRTETGTPAPTGGISNRTGSPRHPA